MKKLALVIALTSAVILSGCSTTNSIPYKVSTANVIKMQEVLKASGKTINVGTITTADGVSESPMCRLMGPVKVAPGKSTTQYIADALQEELFLAQVYDTTAKTSLSATVTDLSFSSVYPATWTIGMNVSSNNGTAYSVKTEYEFNTSWDAVSACKNVADAFGPAVQDLIGKIVNAPEFGQL